MSVFSLFYRKITICILVVFCAITSSFAQDDLFNQVSDSIPPTGYNFGSIVLPDPAIIKESYSYNPVTDQYYYSKVIGDFNMNMPLVLTREEYEKILMRAEMRKYFSQKFDAIHGTLDDEAVQKDMLPRYYVNSKLFSGIFGSNEIDVKPTGSVEFDMGIRHTKQENPLISARNRKSTTFDFDQRISMGLQGTVGTRLAVNANYDTQSSFDFQNIMKLEYASDKDDIVQKLEIGNVSMPISGSLIRGAQSLFGVKTELKFGRTTVTGVFSEQKSQVNSVRAEGGGSVQDFELYALDYDEDRHFFLSQFFRSKYDEALKAYPYINSRVRITKVEVWITNRYNRVSQTNNNLRNIVALEDLGEGFLRNVKNDKLFSPKIDPADFVINKTIDAPTDNKNNKYDPAQIGQNYLTEQIRNSNSGNAGFKNSVQEGLDFVRLESARKLSANEFTFHPQLGYISLQQRLSNDEVLAVAFQYTIGDKVYQVGEFGTDGGDVNIDTQLPGQSTEVPLAQSLILKMLKSTLSSTSAPVWNLMMKNIYQIPNAMNISQDKFRFNLLYTDPSPLNYITQAGNLPLPADVENKPLLQVFNLDRLDSSNNPQNGGDGFFDYLGAGSGSVGSNSNNQNGNNTGGFGNNNNGNFGGGTGGSYGNNNSNNQVNTNSFDGITIDEVNGRIIFTTVEPFGSHLFEKLRNAQDEDLDIASSYNANQKKYVFNELYANIKSSAIRNQSSKNKFQLKGKYSSSMGQGIPIGAFNVAPGSVVVNAGGRVLIEGVDYTVDYAGGRVMILDEALLSSNTPIDISVENNTMFGQQTKTFFGVNVEHQFNKDFKIGGTFLRLSEKPMTHKSMYGQESVNNTIWGFNTQYSTEVPFLTRLVNKLPNIDTDVESRVAFTGEFAYLQPGASKSDQMNGESTAYIDDFEATQSRIDVRSPLAWKLSSVPAGFYRLNDNTADNPGMLEYSLEDGYRRSKLSWYTIDPSFYVGAKPEGVSERDMSSNRTRRIFNEELFATKDIAYGESRVITTLDLTFYPEERGPYNFNPSYKTSMRSPRPKDNWGGIMRSLTTTNFEQANIEFVEFWIMDPYVGRGTDQMPASNSGELRLNFGFISEDILRDGYKQYENGLPGVGSTVATIETIWGKVPAAPSLVYAFDINAQSRSLQDVGLDGLSDEEEKLFFSDFAHLPDPAADNFVHYLDAEGGVLERYKNYNGVERNSPVSGTRGGNNLPDTEDVDGDNTMNTIDAYYEYIVSVNANPQVGENFVTDVRNTSVQLPDGSIAPVRWVQYKVPIDETGKKIGMIADFRSMRFMRMYLTGFEKDITLRFGSIDLVRSDWRRYNASLENDKNNMPLPLEPNTGFDVTSVNIQDNYDRKPIPYVIPPGVQREQFYVNNSIVNQNEQSLSLKVYPIELNKTPDGLAPGDSRGVFKNFTLDLRQYKKLRMFIHAESLENTNRRLQDNEMVAFVRLGSDFTDNFYQVEIPLKVTQFGTVSPELIWPEANELDLELDLLTKLKVMFMNEVGKQDRLNDIFFKTEEELTGQGVSRPNKLRYGIKGNPSFGNVRVMMIGVRNDLDRFNATGDLSGEFWFDELRMSDMDNKGGWAATFTMNANLADFANITASGTKKTIGFGGLEQGPSQRSREEFKAYSIVTNVNLGQLLPKDWGINLPLNYAISEEFVIPEYDPANPDIKLSTMRSVSASSSVAEEIEKRATDYTKRKSINFIGVNKQKNPESKKHVYDIENFTVSHSYNEVIHHDFEIESMIDQQTRSSLDYVYSFDAKPIEPLKNVSLLKNRYFQLFRDFNFNYLPTNIMFNSNVLRQYNKQQYRLIDVEGIGLDPLYRRNYFFNYNFGFNFNLTKSLKLNYIGGSNNLVRNYYDSQYNVIESNTIWDDYFNVGEPNQFTQSMTVNYELPLNKIPFLSFVRSNYVYTGTYNWQRASDAFSQVELDDVTYNLGNTIQNSRLQQLNTTFSMEMLYKYLGLVKTTKKPSTTKKAAIVPGQRVVQADNKDAKERSNGLSNFAIGLLTSVKSIQVNYAENSGTMLPGYMPSIGFFGTGKPTTGFVFGDQADVRYLAAQNGYLTIFPEFNQQFTQVKTKTLNFTASVSPIPDLTIDLTGRRLYAENYSEQFRVENGSYISESPYSYGNFSISTILIGTAFSSNSLEHSQAFEQMKSNRIVIADRLAMGRGIDLNNPNNRDRDGFPIGYGKGSQEVLLTSFLSAYTGENASSASTSLFRDIPLPNWNLRYTGLMKVNWIKDKFRRFSIHHSYNAMYTLGSFTSNFDYLQAPDELNQYNNYPSKTIVNNAILTESFSPLIRIDVETKSAIKILAEMRKDRTLALSFDNNLLTETIGNDFVLGLGYRIKDVGFNSAYANGGMGGRIQSDINIKADLTLSKRETIIRYLDYNNNQLGGGQDLWSLKIMADYMLSKNLTAIFFYDHSFSKAVISTMYPITNVKAGFTMRYSFGN